MSKTILLADDSVTIRKVVELTFMDEDYELDSVGSGEEALGRLEGDRPDLVIADIHMPGVTGYEVCKKVKEGDPSTPVLLLVGTFEPFDPADVEEAGGDRYLKKPFDSQELLVTVRELLAGEAADASAEGEAGGEDAETTESVSSEPPEPPAQEAPEVPDDRIDEVAAAPAETADQDGGGDEPTADAVADLSDEAVDRIAHRVAELLADGALRDVAWEVVPDLAEVVIKERLRELESQVE